MKHLKRLVVETIKEYKLPEPVNWDLTLSVVAWAVSQHLNVSVRELEERLRKIYEAGGRDELKALRVVALLAIDDLLLAYTSKQG